MFIVEQGHIDATPLTFQLIFADAYTVTTATEGRGVASATPLGPFLDGANVTLSAAANSGSRFVRWDFAGSAPCPTSIESTTCQFQIRSNVDATAVFATVMTPQSSRSGAVGTPIDPLLINVTGLDGPITFRYERFDSPNTLSDLHSGLTLETTGSTTARIVGTPTEEGLVLVRIYADDGGGEIFSDLLIFDITGAPAPDTTVPDTTVPGEPAPDTTAPGAPGPDTTVPGTTDPEAPGPGTTVPGEPDSQTPPTGGGAGTTHPGGNAPLLPSAGTGLNNTLSAMGILLVALGGLVLLGASTRRRML